MAPKDIAELMSYDWRPEIKRLADGTFRLTICQVPDFEMFADNEAELQATWREAFESHLSGYLNIGKVVPVPTVKLSGDVQDTDGDPDGSAVFVLNERLEPVG